VFPDAEKLNGVPVAHPIQDDIVRPFRILIPGNVGKGDEIFVLYGNDRYVAIQNSDFSHRPSPGIIRTRIRGQFQSVTICNQLTFPTSSPARHGCKSNR
jgi:hypothetical protein